MWLVTGKGSWKPKHSTPTGFWTLGSKTGSALWDLSSVLPFLGLGFPIYKLRAPLCLFWHLQISIWHSAPTHSWLGSISLEWMNDHPLWGQQFGRSGPFYLLSVGDTESRRDEGLAGEFKNEPGIPKRGRLGPPRAGERPATHSEWQRRADASVLPWQQQLVGKAARRCWEKLFFFFLF